MKKFWIIGIAGMLVFISGCAYEQKIGVQPTPAVTETPAIAPTPTPAITEQTPGTAPVEIKDLDDQKLLWPANCVLDTNCRITNYPDLNNDGIADSIPGFRNELVGHQGTDIAISFSLMDKGISVLSALDGEVLWVFDGKYDRCQYPNSNNPDCKDPVSQLKPNSSEGNTVCTSLGPYCQNGIGSCFWCFSGGNVIVIKHANNSKVFATRYDHLKNGSILVKSGDFVKKGQKIAEVGSAGKSTEPHLHFEVWGNFYVPIDPWNSTNYLFDRNSP